MKILDVQPDWSIGYANDPSFLVTVDRIPPAEELRYQQQGPRYWAEQDGYVSFFHYDGPGKGYGGRAFDLTLKDGSNVTLKGPWSSRTGEMNQYFPHATEVSIKDLSSPYKNLWFSGAMLVSTLKPALAHFRPDLEIRQVADKNRPYMRDEIVYAPAFKYRRAKWESNYGNASGDISWLEGDDYIVALRKKIEAMERSLEYWRLELERREK
jgi:hypothetical protein